MTSSRNLAFSWKKSFLHNSTKCGPHPTSIAMALTISSVNFDMFFLQSQIAEGKTSLPAMGANSTRDLGKSQRERTGNRYGELRAERPRAPPAPPQPRDLRLADLCDLRPTKNR